MSHKTLRHLHMGCGESLTAVLPPKETSPAKPAKNKRRARTLELETEAEMETGCKEKTT